MELFKWFASEVVAATLGLVFGGLLGYSLSILKGRYKRIKTRRVVAEFFGLDNGCISIIHSVVTHPSRNGPSYPSCDTRTTRMIASILDESGLVEGTDFEIVPYDEAMDSDDRVKSKHLERSMVLIGGPTRNLVTRRVLESSAGLRYEMSHDPQSDTNRLEDTVRSQVIGSVGYDQTSPVHGHDFGVIISIPSPFARARVVVLAGIHGAGTIGAGIYTASEGGLRELVARKQGDRVEELVKARFKDHHEAVDDVSIA